MLHSREKILSAVHTAGQFAHVQPESLERELDRLYFPADRESHGRAGHPEEWAVPFPLVRAWKDGFLARQAFRSDTINYLGQKLGIVCSLCLCIQTSERGVKGGWTVPGGFVSFVCPTAAVTPVTMTCVPTLGQPLCSKCKGQIGARLWREYGKAWMADRTDAEWLSVLSWMLTNNSFRARLALYASNINRLRFDPRKADSGKTVLAGYGEAVNQNDTSRPFPKSKP